MLSSIRIVHSDNTHTHMHTLGCCLTANFSNGQYRTGWVTLRKPLGIALARYFYRLDTCPGGQPTVQSAEVTVKQQLILLLLLVSALYCFSHCVCTQ